MASRMERYYKSELSNQGRSSRNKSLYEEIKDLDNYTNIEGVATIDKTNEIDITKVKEMLKNRENYKKQKKLKSILREEQEVLKEEPEKKEEPKNYDINDILSKIKLDENDKNKYRSLDKEQYETLKLLSKKNKKQEIDQEEQELRELMKTIVQKDSLVSQSDLDGDVGLLDELKSDTIVGDASSIKNIIAEEQQKNKMDNTMELDKSFYTSSFGFTQSDFEELKEINHKIKKDNKFIIVLLISLIVIFIVGILVFLIIK